MTVYRVEKYSLNNIPNTVNDSSINREYLHQFIAVYLNDVIVGSLCLYINDGIDYNGEKCMLFGNMYIAQEHKPAFELALQAMDREADSVGASVIIGPINGSTWNEYRLPIDNKKSCFLGDLSYTYDYAEVLETYVFEIFHKYYSSSVDIVAHRIESRIASLLLEGVHIRGINAQEYENELRRIYPLCLEAFKDNELYSFLAEEDFVEQYLQYQSLIDSRFTLIAEDEKGVVAFLFSYWDMANNAIVIKTVARHPKRTYEYLVDTLAKMVNNNASELNISTAIHAFMHLENKSFVLSKRFDATVLREYALFIKRLDG